MDPTTEIKARLPIEELVGQYCQLNKKGRNFTCVCPFHNDKHPSLLVSPDKGIAYCFACQGGGDVFSFYQQIEGVDFKQALKDLAEKAGVTLPDRPAENVMKKDEKDRLRECLEAAQSFYREQLKTNEEARAYLEKRTLPTEQITTFGLGVAPDSFSATYEHLLKAGFSRTDIVKSGLAVQKDLQGKIYDRFRHRLMFPIHDGSGRLVGFGGRTLGDDDAKYINSSDGPLYHKSTVLYGLHHAKEEMRQSKTVYMVEGYFDVLACHRVGITNVIAVSGTALTEEHVKLLKRYVTTVVLCLDQDQAGRQAAERSYLLCSAQDLLVRIVEFGGKDPDEAVNADSEGLKTLLEQKGVPYLDFILQEMAQLDLADIAVKRDALNRLLPLLNALSSNTEKDHYVEEAAKAFHTTPMNLAADIRTLPRSAPVAATVAPAEPAVQKPSQFTPIETTLGLFLAFPMALSVLEELIEPTEGFAGALYSALQALPEGTTNIKVGDLQLKDLDRERAQILQLYWEHHDISDWSDSLAIREIRKNCRHANRWLLREKMTQVKQQLLAAQQSGHKADQEQLATQYRQLLQLAQKSQ